MGKATLPEHEKPIDTKWIFETKQNNLKKARLVAHGFQEVVFHNVYAPVACMTSVRLLLAEAVMKGFQIIQMDVPTTFLNDKFNSDVYIKVQKGVGKENEVYKLKRALYGLKESPRV